MIPPLASLDLLTLKAVMIALPSDLSLSRHVPEPFLLSVGSSSLANTAWEKLGLITAIPWPGDILILTVVLILFGAWLRK